MVWKFCLVKTVGMIWEVLLNKVRTGRPYLCLNKIVSQNFVTVLPQLFCSKTIRSTHFGSYLQSVIFLCLCACLCVRVAVGTGMAGSSVWSWTNAGCLLLVQKTCQSEAERKRRQNQDVERNDGPKNSKWQRDSNNYCNTGHLQRDSNNYYNTGHLQRADPFAQSAEQCR